MSCIDFFKYSYEYGQAWFCWISYLKWMKLKILFCLNSNLLYPLYIGQKNAWMLGNKPIHYLCWAYDVVCAYSRDIVFNAGNKPGISAQILAIWLPT